jgi:uroporphyrinogen decarboxylase
MKSRERVLLSINHKEPDRVPVDLGSMRSTGISAVAYSRLLARLGIKKIPRMYDFIQQLAYPDKEVLDIFNVDCIDASQAFLLDSSDWVEWHLDDGSACLIPSYLNLERKDNGTVNLMDRDGTILGSKPVNSLYVNQVYYAYGSTAGIPGHIDEKDLKKNMWKLPTTPYHLDIFNDEQGNIFSKRLAEFRAQNEYAIMLATGCNLFEAGTRLRGMENFLCDIYQDRKAVIRLLDRITENHLRTLDRIIGLAANKVDILMFGGDDLGSQNAPFLSPEIFSEVFCPFYRKLWDFVHKKTDCKVFLHSCGSIFKLIPALIDSGLDIINPVQTTAECMDGAGLKKEFGNDLVFWGGGCNTRDILPAGTVEEVKEDVKRNIEIFAGNGGFVFSQIHNILADVPAENIIAMFEAVSEYGTYAG